MKQIILALVLSGCTAVNYSTGVREETQACVVRDLMERNAPQQLPAYDADLAELGVVCP